MLLEIGKRLSGIEFKVHGLIIHIIYVYRKQIISSPLDLFSRIGSQTNMPQGAPDLALTFDLHSQALLTAFLENTSFENVTLKLPDAVRMIFDSKLYSFDTGLAKENFIERFVRHETGNAPGVTTADTMLTRFTTDFWKLAQDGGLTLNDAILSRALTAFAMQKYYEEQAAGSTLFSDVSGGGGIQFDMADVSQKFKTVFDNNQKLNLSDAKGYAQYFASYLQQRSAFTADESNLIQQKIPTLRDWYVQAGTSGMNATDTNNRNAFMLGGNGSDTLTGGTANDLLVGNAGADTLTGGTGSAPCWEARAATPTTREAATLSSTATAKAASISTTHNSPAATKTAMPATTKAPTARIPTPSSPAT